jgi:hypothetical protein
VDQHAVCGLEQNFIECPELSGKTIQAVRIYKDTGDGTAVQVELTDGTTFAISHQPTARSSLYRGGVGTPETIRAYDL